MSSHEIALRRLVPLEKVLPATALVKSRSFSDIKQLILANAQKPSKKKFLNSKKKLITKLNILEGIVEQSSDDSRHGEERKIAILFSQQGK